MKRTLLLLILLLTGLARAEELSGSAAPDHGAPPLTVKFACPGAAGKITYHWRFGDGEESTQQNPSHTYGRIGRFAPSVEASKGGKWTGSVNVALNTSVTVGPDGGAGTLKFRAAAGQRLRIHLSGNPNMEPYGHLESASGGNYYPANENAQNGSNQWEGTLPDTGEYTLTVFDGSGHGGQVTVTVEEP